MDIQNKKKLSLRTAHDPIPMPITHINIRQSISILIAKIIVIEVIADFLFLSSCKLLGCESVPFLIYIETILFALFSISLIIYVIFLWLNEYYEVTSNMVAHRKGFLFQSKEVCYFQNISAIQYEQGLLGRLMNFGTIHLYDWELEKYITLYLIHNPKKYYNLLRKLNPKMDEEHHFIRKKLIADNSKI